MKSVINQVQEQVKHRLIRFTIHAHHKMSAEKVSTASLLHALGDAQLLEDYSEHERGACCLVYGKTENGRPLHVVCATSLPELIIITVYEPKPPKWITPYQRRPKT